MSAAYLDTNFALSLLGVTGHYWISTYKVYENNGTERQMVFCEDTKVSVFTVRDRKGDRSNQLSIQ